MSHFLHWDHWDVVPLLKKMFSSNIERKEEWLTAFFRDFIFNKWHNNPTGNFQIGHRSLDNKALFTFLI